MILFLSFGFVAGAARCSRRSVQFASRTTNGRVEFESRSIGGRLIALHVGGVAAPRINSRRWRRRVRVNAGRRERRRDALPEANKREVR